MKKLMLKKIALVFPALLIFFAESCSFSIPNIELKKDYDFAKKKSILIYSSPSGDMKLDASYSNVLYLDIQSRGYQVVNANDLLLAHSELITVSEPRQIADSLLVKEYIPNADVVVIARPRWDSSLVLTYYSKKRHKYWDRIAFKGRFVPTLNSQVVFFDHAIHEPIMGFTASDTTILYADSDEQNTFYSEYPWMVIAKQFSNNLKSIPICEINNSLAADKQFNVCFWVDNTYREAFPETWKDRLILRTLYANDIFRSQFNIELIISEFKEWNYDFKNSLNNSLDKLCNNSLQEEKQLNIAVTLDKDLKIVWKNRSLLGLAAILDNKAIISAQPSFPQVAQYWNPIEEAITLVHEISHLFGAMHSEDEMSIMYATSGNLPYKFDEVNKEIIANTTNNFFEVDRNERVKNYLSILNNLRKSESGNSLQVLEAAGGAITNLLLKCSISIKEKESLDELFISVSPDTAFAYAIKGYLDFNKHNITEARESFTKAFELDPDFAEVNKYLALISEKSEKKAKAKIKTNKNSVVKPTKAEKKK